MMLSDYFSVEYSQTQCGTGGETRTLILPRVHVLHAKRDAAAAIAYPRLPQRTLKQALGLTAILILLIAAAIARTQAILP